MKLFKAYSRTQSADGQNKKKFQWFVTNRKKPVASYEDFIWDYSELASIAQAYSASFLDELLTDYEAALLSEYLKINCKNALMLEEQELPLFFEGDLPFSSFLTSFKQTTESGFYPLFEQANYNLPFNICGFFWTEAPNEYYEPKIPELQNFDRKTKAQGQSATSTNYQNLQDSNNDFQEPENSIKESYEFLSRALTLVGNGNSVSKIQLEVISSYLVSQGYRVKNINSKVKSNSEQKNTVKVS
jgi:hypothetical protein